MITDANFDAELQLYPRVVVMMWRPGCSACKLLLDVDEDGVPKGELVEAARSLPDVQFLPMNSFDNPVTRDLYGVHQCPALLLFRNGQMIAKTFGAAPADIIRQWITTDGKSETPLAEPCEFCVAVRRKIRDFFLRWSGAARA